MGQIQELDVFHPQDIVTVTSKEKNLFDCQGHIVGIFDDGDEGGPIEVVFPDLFHGRIGYMSPARIFSFRFQPTDLRRNKAWLLEVLADELFHDHFHSLLAPKEHFRLGKSVCKVNGCQSKAFARGLLNFVGSVYAINLCPTHWYSVHGHCTESWPEASWLDRDRETKGSKTA